MRTQSDIKEYICKLMDVPALDPIGFKREALLEYADVKTVSYLRFYKDKKHKKGKKLSPQNKVVTDWYPNELSEQSVKRYMNLTFKRAWAYLNDMKNATSLDRDRTEMRSFMLSRMLDRIEVSLWLLEDQEAINFIRDPDKYDSRAVTLFTWLSNRYNYIP
jgi:hypothetical protein